MNRRRFVRATAALAGAYTLCPLIVRAQPRPLAYADMHSHIGILGGRANVREAMTKNGMLVIARKIVADTPVLRQSRGRAPEQFRQPGPGELVSHFDSAFEKVRSEDRAESLVEIDSSEVLDRVMRTGEPGVVLAAEGADFLDGDLKRLEMLRRRGLVHVQLVHYRISEVGDISTGRPVHNGLTAFGRQVVAECNRLGILVDVAHCNSDGIEHALDVSTRPIVYSHGHLSAGSPDWTQGAIRARAISRPLAKKIAQKGGVIGIWPFDVRYSSLDEYVGGVLDAAETLGAAHVGIGSDMFGLPSTVMPGYEHFAVLDERLAKHGVKAEDIGNILGGNYLRVLRQTLAAGHS